MTKIVNFYGGPGIGKSTTAALAYARLKQAGVNCELVREYVKDWAWEKKAITTYDQLYILGKQSRRESMLYGKTDVIVTDSPILLNTYYANLYSPSLGGAIHSLALEFYKQAKQDGYKHIHVMLTRTKPYRGEGRYESEAQAKTIDAALEQILKDAKFPYITATGDIDEMSDLLTRLNLI